VTQADSRKGLFARRRVCTCGKRVENLSRLRPVIDIFPQLFFQASVGSGLQCFPKGTFPEACFNDDGINPLYFDS